MEIKEESVYTKNRLIELSRRSYEQGICLFSDFLDASGIKVFEEIKKELYPCGYYLNGGFPNAERLMVCFGTEGPAEDGIQFPITFLHAAPTAPKYSEELTHRDYLGALMNLGIDRSRIGDLIVKENEALIICEDSLSDFILAEFSRVRHTEVICKKVDHFPEDFLPKREFCEGTISSLRLDAFLSRALNISRGRSSELIASGKVFINGIEKRDLSCSLKPDDRISVRGFGKLRFLETSGETKKSRLKVSWERYV